MNDGNNLPNIPRPTREMPDLIKNIKLFADSRAAAIDAVVQEKNAIISGHRQEISDLNTRLQNSYDESAVKQMEFIKEKKRIIASHRQKAAVNEEIIRSMDRTITQLKEDNALLERSLIQETKNDMKGMFTDEKAIQAIVPPAVEVDPKYREFKRYPLYPVPVYNEIFSLRLQDEFHLDDGRIIQQSQGYIARDIGVEQIDAGTEGLHGYFFDRQNIKAEVQATYYPPNHPLNGFKPAGDIIHTGKTVIRTADLQEACTCTICFCCLCSCRPKRPDNHSR